MAVMRPLRLSNNQTWVLVLLGLKLLRPSPKSWAAGGMNVDRPRTPHTGWARGAWLKAAASDGS